MAAQPAPVFFRNPGEFVAAGAQFVDWTSEREIKNWKSGTKALENKFDLKQENLMTFLNRVKERSKAFSWSAILNVPHGDPAVPTNLIDHYGVITLAECKTFATAYLAQRQRNSQLSAMLYTFLRDSLTAEANNIIDLTPSAYTINDETDGLCLLKHIITKPFVDTKSTVTNIRNNICRLDDEMKELKFDIKAFNHYVNIQVAALAAHNQKCEELMPRLFASYLSVKDDAFSHYVRLHHFQYKKWE
jgi:hypothetical protein